MKSDDTNNNRWYDTNKQQMGTNIIINLRVIQVNTKVISELKNLIINNITIK